MKLKLKHIFALVALVAPFAASAVPAYPGLITRTNPDGTKVEIRLHGDEFFSYATDADNVLMQQNADGYWMPVIKDGVKLVADETVISEMMNAGGAMKMRQKVDRQRMAALDSDGRSLYPTIAEDVHSLVILMEYSDTKFSIPNAKEEIYDWLNKEGYSNYKAVGSVRDYYVASSNGLFSPIFDVAGIVELPKKSNYYARNRFARFSEALEYAVEALDDEVDFSKYDYDDDGVIDTIYFIYAGYGQADTGDTTTVWPHQSTMAYHGITLDGKTFGPYATSNELSGYGYEAQEKYLDGIGAFTHEYGHVLGLPDLYDPQYGENAITPGIWSTMDAGTYNLESTCPPIFSAYEKWVCHWIELEDVVENTHYELLSMDQENKALRIPIYRNGKEYNSEYFVLESRSNDGGWDRGFTDSGLLIWHIDYQKSNWTSNSVNSVPSHPRVYLVTADGSGNPFLAKYGSAKYAPWPGTYVNNTYITPLTEITLDTYASGTENNHYITSIAYDAEARKSTFNYNVVTESPDLITLMHTPNSLFNGRNRPVNSLRFAWDAVEGATNYQLTVWRENESGEKLYVGGCNEMFVGNVTQFDVENISSYMWTETMYAYVRVVKELPSYEISNIVTFVPDELERVPMSSIDDVAADAVGIYGLQGKIVAPEDARVYNLSGVETGKENLPAGIYIVRSGNNIVKVVVKD